MPTPALVIADASFKTYPGGIIVLRCSDWLGPARGTLSTEADARSACGTVVRDTQQVAGDIYDAINWVDTTAFDNADDTLVVDLATLPIEVGCNYVVLFSCLIEGDWNSDDLDSHKYSDQEWFASACTMTMHGTSDLDGVSFPPYITHNRSFRKTAQYRIVGMGGGNWAITAAVGDEVVRFRAFAKENTTCEWLLDQIYLVPAQFQTQMDGWNSNDFSLVGPDLVSYSSVEDGTDGGDANGKFTRLSYPGADREQTGTSGGDGGGDYQKDDSEYMVNVKADGDFFWLSNSQAVSPDDEADAHCYGIHGPWYLPEQQPTVSEGFTTDIGGPWSLGNYGDPENTLTGGWSRTPEGFVWKVLAGSFPAVGPVDWVAAPYGNHRHGSAIWVENGELHSACLGSPIDDGTGRFRAGLVPLHADGAGVALNHGTFSGKMRSTELEAPGTVADPTIGYPYIQPSLDIDTSDLFGTVGGNQNALRLHIDLISKEWRILDGYNGENAPVSSTFPISWFSLNGGDLGWRIEIKRYRVRARVWDASGAEPSTWDYDEFRPMGSFNNSPVAYPYGDDLSRAATEYDQFRPAFEIGTGNHGTVGAQIFSFRDLVVEYDPYGNEESAWALMEQPEGVEVGRIELPVGCQHLVYWGRRDWTVYLLGDGPYIEFASKVWNNGSAAELQRAEAVWWWFRSVRPGGIISMNWRSSSRKSTSRRVLV